MIVVTSTHQFIGDGSDLLSHGNDILTGKFVGLDTFQFDLEVFATIDTVTVNALYQTDKEYGKRVVLLGDRLQLLGKCRSERIPLLRKSMAAVPLALS